MNRLINIVLSGLLWRRYKFLIVSLVVLVLSIILTGRIHADYVEFAKSAEKTDFLGYSFAIKWGVWILLFVCFFIANNLYNKHKEKTQMLSENKQSVMAKFLNRDKRQSKEEVPALSEDVDDPFEHIRQKDKLRSYAEVLIDKHDKHTN